MGVEESQQIAQLIIKALVNHDNSSILEEVRQEVRTITDRFPLYENL